MEASEHPGPNHVTKRRRDAEGRPEGGDKSPHLEVEGERKPACVAETLGMYFFKEDEGGADAAE